MATKITQDWQTRTVTQLLKSACGDLMLDGRGDLCYKRTYDITTCARLPTGQYRAGEKLAVITSAGWTLTPAGAQFILENCPPEKSHGHDVRCLRIVAGG